MTSMSWSLSSLSASSASSLSLTNASWPTAGRIGGWKLWRVQARTSSASVLGSRSHQTKDGSATHDGRRHVNGQSAVADRIRLWGLK